MKFLAFASSATLVATALVAACGGTPNTGDDDVTTTPDASLDAPPGATCADVAKIEGEPALACTDEGATYNCTVAMATGNAASGACSLTCMEGATRHFGFSLPYPGPGNLKIGEGTLTLQASGTTAPGLNCKR